MNTLFFTSQNSSGKSIIDHLTRRDSGFLRLLIIFIFSILGIFGLYLSYLLLIKGVKGEFTVFMDNLKGFQLYVSSVAPGILMIIAVVWILSYALPKTLESMMK